MTKAMALLLERYRQDVEQGCEQRLGQWFCNKYIKRGKVWTWAKTDLFYETKNTISRQTISAWMEDNCYVSSLPPEVR